MAILYKSPIGILQIKNAADFISEVSFIETKKKSYDGSKELTYSINSVTVIKNCIEQLDDYFSGKSLIFDIPLLQEGTPFQQSVWAELQKIPYGRTVSYQHLSKTIGNIKATRAVGTANGKNNIAIVVPCHRVIGSNGSLVGYGGDLWRKQWLLEHEAKYAHGVQALF